METPDQDELLTKLSVIAGPPVSSRSSPSQPFNNSYRSHTLAKGSLLSFSGDNAINVILPYPKTTLVSAASVAPTALVAPAARAASAIYLATPKLRSVALRRSAAPATPKSLPSVAGLRGSLIRDPPPRPLTSPQSPRLHRPQGSGAAKISKVPPFLLFHPREKERDLQEHLSEVGGPTNEITTEGRPRQ